MGGDTIRIVDLELWTRLGVPESERAAPQRVRLTVEFPVDAPAVARIDDLSGSIDYEAVVRSIRALAGTERRTLERFAEDVAARVLREHGARSVRVTVRKFPLPGVREVSLTIERP
jgi:FolB domain-containing protein